MDDTSDVENALPIVKLAVQAATLSLTSTVLAKAVTPGRVWKPASVVCAAVNAHGRPFGPPPHRSGFWEAVLRVVEKNEPETHTALLSAINSANTAAGTLLADPRGGEHLGARAASHDPGHCAGLTAGPGDAVSRLDELLGTAEGTMCNLCSLLEPDWRDMVSQCERGFVGVHPRGPGSARWAGMFLANKTVVFCVGDAFTTPSEAALAVDRATAAFCSRAANFGMQAVQGTFQLVKTDRTTDLYGALKELETQGLGRRMRWSEVSDMLGGLSTL
jgi:hypothetical protein